MKTEDKKWVCPCNGCSKAVKQERKRIIDEMEKIDLNSSYQLNAVGFKILMSDIIKGI